MAKAAAQLGVSQPSVSEVMADLEHALGVRLLDRSPQGIEPTIYAHALLKRSRVAFDELKQGIRDIEYLSDPTVGELRIGCPESISSSILPAIIQRLSEQHPRVVPRCGCWSYRHNDQRVCLIAALMSSWRGAVSTLADDSVIDRLEVEVLFQDEVVVAAGAQSKWARRRKIELAELVDERWIMSAPGTWNHMVMAEAFRARGLDMPRIGLTTLSMSLRTNLVATSPSIGVFPDSVLRVYGDWFSLKRLPVDLPARPWPVTIVTLKNRTLSPLVERFIECAREVAKSFASPPRKRP